MSVGSASTASTVSRSVGAPVVVGASTPG
jgi:hypothetical protein